VAEIYFRDNNDITYTDTDLKMLLLDYFVQDFPEQVLIQDEIPYSNIKVTYGRKIGKRTITITFMFDVNTISDLNQQITVFEAMINTKLIIGFIDHGFEYECNYIGEVKQEDIKKHLKKYTFTFETTSPARTAIT